MLLPQTGRPFPAGGYLLYRQTGGFTSPTQELTVALCKPGQAHNCKPSLNRSAFATRSWPCWNTSTPAKAAISMDLRSTGRGKMCPISSFRPRFQALETILYEGVIRFTKGKPRAREIRSRLRALEEGNRKEKQVHRGGSLGCAANGRAQSHRSGYHRV